MLKFESVGDEITIETEGAFADIMLDVAAFLHYLHADICKHSFLAGMEFEKLMRDPEYIDMIFKAYKGDADQEEETENEQD